MPKRGLAAVIYGREGSGKTSIGLQFPEPIKCLSIGENGYKYLEDVHATPENSVDIEITSYKQLVDETKKTAQGTLLIDGLKGVQSIIFDHVKQTVYGGNDTKFNAYSEGPRKFAPPILQEYLNLCSILNSRGVHTIFLGHMGTTTLVNAMGADQYCHVILMDDGDKGGMRSTIRSWSGLILFINNEVMIETATDLTKSGNILEGKALKKDIRVMYTTTSVVHEAKNRWNLPATIAMGASPKEAFNNLWKLVPDTYK